MILISKLGPRAERLKLNGTLMALDWGQKRVGYASADPLGIAITPRGHFKRHTKTKRDTWQLSASDIASLKKLKTDWEVEHWVLGWPVNKQGIESEASRLCADLAQQLEKELEGEFILVDETLTSWEQKNSKDVDAGAAATILQDFFEQNRRLKQSGNVRVTLLLVLGVVLALAGFVGHSYYQFAYQSAGTLSEGAPSSVVVDVKPGSSFQSIRKDLESNLGFRINENAFRVWSRLNLSGKKLRIGEYRIQKSWSAKKIFDELVSGSPLLYKVVVKEGYHKWDILLAFEESRGRPSSEYLEKELKNLKHLESLEFLKTQTTQPQSLEGFLFPETYSYQKYDSPKKLVASMIEQFKKRALPILEQHPWAKTPGGLYRLLILASIVEKESGLKEEQPMIASVFWNRLAKRMKLQSDPTTIYGLLPDFSGNLTKAHLLTPSPWNTYTLPELPLTPISNPGESALRAVVSPAQSDNLFFVSRNDGTHLFSADYKTHNSYVEEYQKRRKGVRAQQSQSSATSSHLGR